MRRLGIGLVLLLLLLLAPSPARSDDPFWAMRHEDGWQFEPTLGVGPNSIIQVGNYCIMAFDREGVEQWRARLNIDEEPESFSPNYFWAIPPQYAPFPGDGGIDVRVLYDQFARRFIVMSMRKYYAGLYLAISKDSHPEGHGFDDWDKFYIDLLAGSGNSISKFHYAGLAVDQGAIYISSIFGEEHAVQILKRPNPANYNYYFYELDDNHRMVVIPTTGTDPGLDPVHRLPMPAHFFGTMAPNTLYLVQLTWYSRPPGQRAEIRLAAATVEATGIPELVYHTVDVEIPGETDAQHRSQLCPHIFVAYHLNIQNVVWRNGRLYFTRIHDKSDGYPGESPKRFVAHWYVVDTHNWPHGNSVPEIVEDGVVDGGRIFINDDPLDDRPVHIIYPLVMPTAAGDVAIFFSRFHAYGYMDLCFTSRRAQDPPGVLGAGVHRMTAGGAGVSEANKWGDYEGVALDPQNPNLVWATGETGRCTPETPCDPCPWGGQHQGYWHTVIGSYTIPQVAAHTLTIEYRVDAPAPLPDCHVKVRPPDAAGQADVVLTEAVPAQTRLYGHANVAILRAPDLSAQGLEFDHWELGYGANAPPCERELTLIVSADITATAWYNPE